MLNIAGKKDKAKYLITLFKYTRSDLTKKGIYSISFKGSDKIYIGAATQAHTKWNECGFYIRWRYHIYGLINNKHPNKKLQYSFNKRGINNINFTIIKDMSHCSKEEIFTKEAELIEKYDCVKDGYNCCVKDTFETYNKSKTVQTKKVFVYNYSGECIKEFESRSSCAIFYSLSRKRVSCNIRFGYPYNGYFFLNDNNFSTTLIENRRKPRDKNKNILVYDSKNDTIKSFANVNDLGDYYQIKDRRNIYLCLNKKIPSTNGLIIINESDRNGIVIPTKNYYCIMSNGAIINKYESLRLLCIDLKYSKTSVENYILGVGRKGHIKEEIKKIRLPITIYENFLNKTKTYDQRGAIN